NNQTLIRSSWILFTQPGCWQSSRRNCSSLITLRHSWSSKPGHAPQPARHLDSVLSGYRLATSRPCIILYRGIRNADATPILVDFSTPNPSALLSFLGCARQLWTLAKCLLWTLARLLLLASHGVA